MAEEQNHDTLAEQAGALFEQIGPILHGEQVETILTVFGGVIGSMASDHDDLIGMMSKVGGLAQHGMMLNLEGRGLGVVLDEEASLQ